MYSFYEVFLSKKVVCIMQATFLFFVCHIFIYIDKLFSSLERGSCKSSAFNMEQIGKAFIGLTVIILITFIGIGIISTSIDASHAESFASETAAVIESSNYSEKIINMCKDPTQNNKNYIVEVTEYDTDSDGYTDMAEIRVKYRYSIPILNVKGSMHTAKAYAR